jgi:NAD(P)-dependent dehydrogenase (short-subunit alcohol dehydrogenase family)
VAAIEYGKEGIRINAVCPGVIETNLGREAPEELVKENLTPVIEATPLGRAGQPEEVAQVVCFLSSLRATYVNGSSMTVCSESECY